MIFLSFYTCFSYLFMLGTVEANKWYDVAFAPVTMPLFLGQVAANFFKEK